MTNPFKKPELPRKTFRELSRSEFEQWHDKYDRYYTAKEKLPLRLSSAAIIISILSLIISTL